MSSRSMKRGLVWCLALIMSAGLAYGDVNVLIVGSSRDAADNSMISGSSDPFPATEIRNQLYSILSQAGLGAVNVTLLDRSAEGHSTSVYSLAQWFHYPYPSGIETTTRWPNLRGVSGVDWDYVILIGDPYTMEYMPGLYAQGVAAVAEEVAKGAGETVLLMPWPASASSSSVEHYREVVYRAGRTGGYKVAPAALAWQADGAQISVTPVSARGAYICAASIYSRVWGQSATNSTYSYNDTLADNVHAVVTNAMVTSQYSGKFSIQNPFLMLGDTRRDIQFSDKGSSTEQAFRGAVSSAMDRSRVSYETQTYNGRYLNNTPEDDGLGWPSGNPMPLAWNHGRKWSEIEKQYEVNTNYWQLGMGFKYQWNNYSMTAEDANDFLIKKMFDEDFDLADFMITQDDSARSIPWRWLWALYHKQYPATHPIADSVGHLHANASGAVGTYMYTLYSGRCPLDPEPSTMNASWFALKIGYESAWRMGTCSTRAPGFKVMPSAKTALTVTPTTTETMTVQFIFQPRSNVTVTVSSSDTSAGIVGTQKLVFTPSNYKVPQAVTVTGVPGSPDSAPFNVVFTTTSDDPAYDALSDSWEYTTVRSTLTVTRTDNGTSQYSTPKNIGVRVNLNASAANAANTVFAGPNKGVLSWNGPDVIYTPTTNYIGPDGFAYSAMVGLTLTVGYIDIDVLGSYPVGAVRAEATDSTASEGGPTTGTLTIIREGDTASSLAVNFAMSGTATFGADYTLSASSPVTIPAGTNAISITLTPVDDAVVGERTETASLTVTAGAGYTVVSNPATVSITDNDNTLPVVNAGTNQTVKLVNVYTTPGLWYGTAPVLAATTPNPKTELLVDVASRTEDGIAANTTEIYTGQIYDDDGSISFKENLKKGLARIWINGVLVINDDKEWRSAYTTNLNLSPGWHDIEIRISGIGPGGIGYDPNGTAMWQTFVDPGDGSLLRVLDAPIRGVCVVNLNGTVTDAEDTPGTIWSLVSGPGVATVRFGSVYAVDTSATFTEPGVYVLRLTAEDGYGPVYDELTITVIDRTSVSVSATDAVTSETGSDTGTFTISRVGDAADPVIVHFAMSGTATFGDDYTLSTSSPISFLAGQTSSVVTLTPVDDTVFDEGFEAAILTITGIDDATHYIGTASGQVVIADNDISAPVVNCAAGAVSLSETSATLRGVLSASFSADAWICWGITDAGADGTGYWDNVVSVGAVTRSDPFSINVAGLATNTTYFYRCYATNSAGTGWSDASIFSGTPAGIAAVANLAPSAITNNQATLNGELSASGTNYDVYVYWGTFDGGAVAGLWATNVFIGSWTNVATNVVYTPSLTPGQTYWYTFMASNAMTNIWASPSWQFTTPGIAKTNPTVSAWPTSTPITYGQACADAGLSGGTASVSGSFSYNSPTAIPNAGTNAAAVTFTPDDTTNYNTVAGSVNVVVSKATPTVNPWPTATSIETGQAVSNAVLTGGSGSVGGTFAFQTPAQTPPVGTNIVNVVFTPAASANYNTVTGTVDVVVTAELIPATVTLSNLGQTYDGTARPVAVTTVPSNLAVSVTYAGSGLVPTNVGSYSVVATITESGYKGSTNGTLVVSKATPAVGTWPTATSIHVGQAVSNSSLSGGSSTPSGSFSFDSPAYVPAEGTYGAAVTFTPDDVSNWLTAGGTVNVTVLPLPPAVPAGLAATSSVSQVMLDWTASSGATSYSIKRSYVSGSNYVVVGSTALTSFTNSPVANGAKYYYVVSASNAGGEGSNSAEVVVTLQHKLPFAEDYEALTTGDLDGQNGWAASDAVVQTTIAVSGKAARVTAESGYVEHSFAGSESNVWTDMKLRPVFVPEHLDAPPDTNMTAVFYVYTNGHPVVFNGTNRQELSTVTVTNDTWVRLTVKSDYAAKTWDFFVDGGQVATNLGFYNAAVSSYASLTVKGGGASNGVMDDVSIGMSVPFGEILILTVNSDHGAPHPSLGTTEYVSNSVVSAWISDTSVTNGLTNYVCTGWTRIGSNPGSGTETNTTFTITNDTTLTWQWKTNYWVTLLTSGDTGTLDHVSAWYDAGTSLTVTATATNYSVFSEWQGNTNGATYPDSNSISFGVSGAKTITAVFEPQLTISNQVPYRWLADVLGIINGFEAAVTNDPDGDTFTTGEEYWSGTDPMTNASYLHIASIEMTATNFRLIWTHSNIQNYVPKITIQSRASLSAGSWSNAAVHTAYNGTNSWGAPGQQAAFYRLCVTNVP